jgi:hypothetical protein
MFSSSSQSPSSLSLSSPLDLSSPLQLLLFVIEKILNRLEVFLELKKKISGNHDTWYTTLDIHLLYYYALETAYNEYLILCTDKCSPIALQHASLKELIICVNGCHKHIPCLQTNVVTL